MREGVSVNPNGDTTGGAYVFQAGGSHEVI
jgi:hypothetical protein